MRTAHGLLLLCVVHSGIDEFTQLARTHARALRGTALRLTRDPHDADDLVQDALLRALGAWGRFATGTNFRAWMARILTNSFINGYRRGVRDRAYVRHERALAAIHAQLEEAESAAAREALSDEVVAAIDALPAGFRRAVTLCDLGGLSYRDAARRMGCPVGTVMSRLHRGRRLLERRLEPLAREQGILRRAA